MVKANKNAEEEMRARIEEEMRAKIEAEMRAKIEAEMRVKLEQEAKAALIKGKTGAAPKFKRPVGVSPRLARSLDVAFDKLEAYFPEGKVFAFDGVDSELRERMAALYPKAGYVSLDEMLRDYGFEIISGEEVKELRPFVLYSPGNEPEIIKKKVDNVLALMEEYYPDRVVPRSIQRDHKSLAGKLSGLYQWLGYESVGAMLRAYGYEYNVAGSGRPVNDFQPVLDALVEKYKNGPKPRSMGELLYENPELKGTLKTLQNKASEVFGMTLKKYFQQIGIFEESTAPKARSARTTPDSAGDSVMDHLRARYETADPGIYGTAEEAVACLKGMTVKRNKSGQIYIFRAAGCGGSVRIPYGIDFISDGAFMRQLDLEEVHFPAGITEIPAEAFRGCSKLTVAEIPEGVVSIEAYAFSGCTALKSIVLPKSLQKIAAKAFADCTELKSVKLGNPGTLISQDAFDGCKYEPRAEIGPAATDAKHFQYKCDAKGNITITGLNGKLEQLVIPGMIDGHSVTAIGKGAFQGNQYLVEVTMPDFITTMQGDVFRDCISLKKVHLSNSLTKIITTAFSGCIGLEEVNIPDAVTEVKRHTFKDSPIKTLHIGKSLMSLESQVFYNGKTDAYTGKKTQTRAIRHITVAPQNPYLKAVGSAVYSRDGKTLLAFLGDNKQFAVPEGVEVIGFSAFEGLVFLADVTLPGSVTEIQKKAFYGTSLRNITIGTNIRSIKEYAFSNCWKLTSAVFEPGIEEIGDYAFDGCPIVSVILPASLSVLGKSSFKCLSPGYYGESRQTIEIDPQNRRFKTDKRALYEIADDGKTLLVFYDPSGRQINYGTGKAQTYKVAAGTKHIAPSAFRGCQSLGKVTLPDGVVSIGENAFMECGCLEEIILPNSVETIGAFAFKGTSIESFEIGPNVRSIGEGALVTGQDWHTSSGKRKGIEVDAANQVLYVDKKTLYQKKDDGTSRILNYFGTDAIFAVPEGVSEICSTAFSGSNVEEIQIPASVTAIGEQAFFGCGKLTRLRVGFAEPENGANFAVVYLPEASIGYNYAEMRLRDQYMDCIRVDGSGNVFDFVKYDSLFESIQIAKNKILVATDRLKSAIQLVPLYRDQYLAYLRKNAKKAVEIVVEFDDLSGLNTLAELGVFTGKNIDSVIELANKTKKTEILSYLMNYKNSKIGIAEEDYDL